jgi:hypothetical protein
MRRWLPPKHASFGSGTRTRRAGDLVFGTAGPFLASRRFVEAWTRDGLGGVDRWDPVEVVGQSARSWFHPVLPFPTVRANWRSMDITWKREPACPDCSSGYWTRFRGLAIEKGSWSGQALFTLVNFAGFTLVSEGFQDWALAEGFENVDIVPVEDYGRDELQGDLIRADDGTWGGT